MFELDKLVIGGAVKSCTIAGSIFGLGPIEGIIIYVLAISLLIAVVIEARAKKK